MGTRDRFRRSSLALFLGILLGACVFFQGKAAGEARALPEERPVTVWHIPHPDDETLGMAGGILAARAAGRRNVVVLYTQGGSSDVRLVLNGVFFCRIHGRYHDPLAEGYHPLDLEAFKAARVRESREALKLLGVADEDVIVLDFPDGGLQMAPVLAVMQELDQRFPGAQHRTTSVTDRHHDHQVLARALYRLKELAATSGRQLDVAFYRVYQYDATSTQDAAAGQSERAAVLKGLQRRNTGCLWPITSEKRAALQEFARWEPAAGRFAIGLHSVPRLFAVAAADPHEYVDVLDERVLGSLRWRWRLGLDLYLRETALSYSIAPRWTLQVSAPYSIDTVRSALVYEQRSLERRGDAFCRVRHGVERGGVAPYVLAGVSIVDSIVVKYRPQRSSEDLGSSLQIGWKLQALGVDDSTRGKAASTLRL